MLPEVSPDLTRSSSPVWGIRLCGRAGTRNANAKTGHNVPIQHQEFPGSQEKMTPKPAIDELPTEEGGYQKYKAAGKLEGKKAVITGGDSGKAVPKYPVVIVLIGGFQALADQSPCSSPWKAQTA